MKVRQEIFLEALKPFRFWSLPSNSHRVKPLKLPCGDTGLGGGWPQSAPAPLPFLGPCERNGAAPRGRHEENGLMEGCGHSWLAAITVPVSRLRGGFSSGFARRAREAGCQESISSVGEKPHPSGLLGSLWSLDWRAFLSPGWTPQAGSLLAPAGAPGPGRGHQGRVQMSAGLTLPPTRPPHRHPLKMSPGLWTWPVGTSQNHQEWRVQCP